jgi:putative copper resistance protein D
VATTVDVVAWVPAPTLRNLVVPVAVDPAAALLTVAAGLLYMRGVALHRQHGYRWRGWRTISFLTGLVVIVVATQAGLARYDTSYFSWHVVQHILLAMVAPVFLVLGAPVTLALQASNASGQRTLLRLLQNPLAVAVTHPITAWCVFAGTLFVVYFTPLYGLSLRNSVVHAWLHVHFVVSGCLFAESVVGLDPHRVRLPHPARLLLVALTVPVHAVLGIALLARDDVIAGAWYLGRREGLGDQLLLDQRLGAGLLWAAGELYGVALAALVLTQWMHHSEREARRHDRLLDALAGPP